MGKPIVVTKKAVTESAPKEKKVVAKGKLSKESAEKKTIKLNTIPAMLILAKEKIEPLLKVDATTKGATGKGFLPLALKAGEKIDVGGGKMSNQLAVIFEYDHEKDYTGFKIQQWPEIKKDEKTVTKIWKRFRAVARPLVLALRKAEREAAAKDKKVDKKVVAKKSDKKAVDKKKVVAKKK